MLADLSQFGALNIGPEDNCEYLSDKLSQLEFIECVHLTKEDYRALLDENWRRFGVTLFRPRCQNCSLCAQLRIKVDEFSPNRTQQRVWVRNCSSGSGGSSPVGVRFVNPTLSLDHLSLYHRYHSDRSERRGWSNGGEISPVEYAQSFIFQPFQTEEWQYIIDERLVGVGHVDVLPDALSAIYFFSEPDESRRSLGVYNILHLIEEAKKRNLDFVYLGYYVEGSRSMAYKSLFRPCEILLQGKWQTPK